MRSGGEPQLMASLLVGRVVLDTFWLLPNLNTHWYLTVVSNPTPLTTTSGAVPEAPPVPLTNVKLKMACVNVTDARSALPLYAIVLLSLKNSAMLATSENFSLSTIDVRWA